MTPLFFLIPLFSVFATDPYTGEFFEVPVFATTDIEQDCNHMGHVGGCIMDIHGYVSIVCIDPFAYSHKGYNCLTHEWLHIMGLFKESEIPDTQEPSQEFRK